MLNQLEHVIRKVNREVINPMIPPLDTEHMLPVLAAVAKARGVYLKELFDTAKSADKGSPTEEQLTKLRQCRKAYEEMMAGAQALEIVVERGYLDFKP